MKTYIVTTNKGRRFRVENYGPGERTKGGGDKSRPSIGVFDLTYPESFGDEGQFVAAYAHADLPAAGAGLNMNMGSPAWRLDADTVTRIRTWLVTGETLGSDADVQCAQCGLTGQVRAPLYAEPHERADRPGTPCVYVRMYSRHFLPEDVVEGDIVSDDVHQRVFDCTPDEEDTTVAQAVRAITDEGLTFEGSTSWASDPEGSYVLDHYTGERVERSAHLYGFTEDEEAAIITAVQNA